MKNLFKRISAGLLALMIVISLLGVSVSAATITTSATGYTKASDVVYKTGNKGWIYNWGARGETCVFLSSKAQSFYTGSNTFESLSKLSGGSSQSNAPQSSLYSSLAQLMKSSHSYVTSYDATKQMYGYTDCVSGNGSQMSSFYSGKTLSSKWDSAATWNREHTWPKSKNNGTSAQDDIMMLRPTSVSENSSRGNTAYGESSGYYDPGTSTRGDVARIVLYVYVRWGNTQYMWGKSGVMENLNVLLKWMQEDPVDTWEMGRNDAVQSITGTRNVFVDYPEYAWLLFGQNVPAGITTPSDNDGVTANPGGNSGSSSGNSGSSGNTGSGNSGSSSGSTGTTSMITSPETGKAYKLSMNNGKDLYFMGVINKDSTPWYMKSSENVADAIDVYLEAASGGYRLYFTINGAKTYLVMYKDGTHYSLKLTTEPSTVYTWNSQYNTLVAMNEDKECFIGTSGTYNTFSCNTMDKVGSSYVAHLFGVGGSSSGGNNGGTTTTNPPATQPPATNPPATNPPATQPPATQPPASQPGTGEGTPATTPSTLPAGPAPMETKPLDPNDFYTAPEEDNTTTIVIIVSIVVGILALGIVAFFIVMNAKKRANAAPVEIAETPSEENAEQPETETDTPAENE